MSFKPPHEVTIFDHPVSHLQSYGRANVHVGGAKGVQDDYSDDHEGDQKHVAECNRLHDRSGHAHVLPGEAGSVEVLEGSMNEILHSIRM